MCLHHSLLTISFSETMELICSPTSLSSSFALSSSLYIPLSGQGYSWFCVVPIILRSPENQMTVSVTGATGFTGRRLVQRLRVDNHSVRVLTRSKSKAEKIFPGKKVCLIGKGEQVIQKLRNENNAQIRVISNSLPICALALSHDELLQTQGIRIRHQSAKKAIGFIEAITLIPKEDGIKGYWKENLPQVIRGIEVTTKCLMMRSRK